MEVVMELCRPHHRAALRRNSGRRNAGGDPAEPARCRRSISRHERRRHPHAAARPRSRTCTLITARATSCTASRLRSAPAKWSGLLGRNGVGKSTTLKTIMGLVQPSQGKVLLDGNAITGLPAHKLARLGIGYVPEDRRIFRLLTVMENLRTGLDRHGVTEERRQSAARQGIHVLPGAEPSGATRPAARCRAASSRCWRSPAP